MVQSFLSYFFNGIIARWKPDRLLLIASDVLHGKIQSWAIGKWLHYGITSRTDWLKTIHPTVDLAFVTIWRVWRTNLSATSKMYCWHWKFVASLGIWRNFLRWNLHCICNIIIFGVNKTILNIHRRLWNRQTIRKNRLFANWNSCEFNRNK